MRLRLTLFTLLSSTNALPSYRVSVCPSATISGIAVRLRFRDSASLCRFGWQNTVNTTLESNFSTPLSTVLQMVLPDSYCSGDAKRTRR